MREENTSYRTNPYTEVPVSGTSDAIVWDNKRHGDLVDGAQVSLGPAFCTTAFRTLQTTNEVGNAPYLLPEALLMSHMINSPFRALVKTLLLKSGQRM